MKQIKLFRIIKIICISLLILFTLSLCLYLFDIRTMYLSMITGLLTALCLHYIVEQEKLIIDEIRSKKENEDI